MSLKGKVVVITGSSAGIGAATAVAFAKEGCRVVLHGRNEAKLKEVGAKCVAQGIQESDVAYCVGDLADDSAVDNIVKTTLDTFGQIDVLYNNAGYVSAKEGPIHMGGTVEGLDDMYRINIRVPYMLVQQFVPSLTKTKGAVINCSSGYSLLADPKMISYCTTKAGQDHMTKIMAMSLGMRGIRVNGINMGYVETDIIKKALGSEAHDPYFDVQRPRCPLEQKLATPEDIANVVVFLASDKSTAITGARIMCDKAATLTHPVFEFTDYK